MQTLQAGVKFLEKQGLRWPFSMTIAAPNYLIATYAALKACPEPAEGRRSTSTGLN
jgi:hypothetical protein